MVTTHDTCSRYLCGTWKDLLWRLCPAWRTPQLQLLVPSSSQTCHREAVVRARCTLTLLRWMQCPPHPAGDSPSVWKHVAQLLPWEMAGRAKKRIQKSSKSKADSFPWKKKKKAPKIGHGFIPPPPPPPLLELRKVTEAMIYYPEWKWWKQRCFGPVPLWGARSEECRWLEERLISSTLPESCQVLRVTCFWCWVWNPLVLSFISLHQKDFSVTAKCVLVMFLSLSLRRCRQSHFLPTAILQLLNAECCHVTGFSEHYKFLTSHSNDLMKISGFFYCYSYKHQMLCKFQSKQPKMPFTSAKLPWLICTFLFENVFAHVGNKLFSDKITYYQ